MEQAEQAQQCPSCQTILYGDYCHRCGRSRHVQRIDGAFILSEVGSILNLHKGIFFTIRELLRRPGITVRKFIHGERNRLVKPVVFIVITSIVYALTEQLFPAGGRYFSYAISGASLGGMQDHYGHLNFLIAFLAAFWVRVLFRKSGYNFFELLVLLSFLLGMRMLMLAVFRVRNGLFSSPLWDIVESTLPTIYVIWGIGQFFNGKKVSNYLKAFIGYELGIFSFFLIAALLGILTYLFQHGELPSGRIRIGTLL